MIAAVRLCSLRQKLRKLHHQYLVLHLLTRLLPPSLERQPSTTFAVPRYIFVLLFLLFQHRLLPFSAADVPLSPSITHLLPSIFRASNCCAPDIVHCTTPVSACVDYFRSCCFLYRTLFSVAICQPFALNANAYVYMYLILEPPYILVQPASCLHLKSRTFLPSPALRR